MLPSTQGYRRQWQWPRTERIRRDFPQQRQGPRTETTSTDFVFGWIEVTSPYVFHCLHSFLPRYSWKFSKCRLYSCRTCWRWCLRSKIKTASFLLWLVSAYVDKCWLTQTEVRKMDGKMTEGSFSNSRKS